MNIAFDAAAILGPMSKNRGIGNYAYSQFRTMIELDQKNTYYFFNMFEEFSMKDAVKKENIIDVCFFSGKNRELISDKEYQDIYGDIVKKFIRQNQIDVFYITSPFDLSVIQYRKEWFEGVKTVATVYDIIPYVLKKKYLSDRTTYCLYMKCVQMLRWVDEYLVISQSVKDDMISYLNFPEEHIHVIYGAVDPKIYRKVSMTEQETQELFDRFQIQGRYIMCTGGDDDRKNIAGLIQAYSKIRRDLRERYQLVIVCRLSPPSAERYSLMIREKKLEERVILTNFVSTQDMVRLYSKAALLAFPSLYEGFGLPVLEAWMCGVPVLTSNNSSLGEIGGDAAILVNADSIQSITDGINFALTEADLECLRKKAEKKLELFNWESVVRTAMAVIHSLRIANSQEIRLPEVKKIAMFTPLPPIQSGIADYSADIISELESEFEIDVYIDKYRADFKENERVHIYPAKAFEKKRSQYDRIVYQVGNSLYHSYMFPFIKKYPGIVVLHDYDLRNVLEALYLYQTKSPKIFVQHMLEDYGQEAVDDYMQHLNTPYTAKFEINGFVTNYAEKIIVHSLYAKKRLLLKDIGKNVHVIPHYAVIHQEKRNIDITETGDSEGESFVFAAFGHIHESKRAIPALTAFGRICKEQMDKKMKFYFVGKMAEELRGEFEDKVRTYGLEDRVSVTGYVPMEDFQSYLDRTDVCVNLRYPYHGESSGSFMRELAKGKCVIVNRIGSFGEVPENACIMIPNVERMRINEEIQEIYQAMKLAMDDSVREKIQYEADKYARSYLDLKRVGKQYIQAIKEKTEKKGMDEKKLKMFAQKYVRQYSDDEIERLAETLAYVSE
ncbi:MAG: glycosyltransferase [Eubacterium sp.]|nr:glycosyltransferase [Eubacterium sp.]